jgi:hypothetical protein
MTPGRVRADGYISEGYTPGANYQHWHIQKIVKIQTSAYTCGHKKVLLRRLVCKVGKLHSGTCGAGIQVCACKGELYCIFLSIWVASDSSQSHRAPTYKVVHTNFGQEVESQGKFCVEGSDKN